ncbi:hypothetical protein FLP41_16025 [Paracoccus marcusii]|uniref:hypothetical protein n=1 Tax=Paracoccus marcusii TaxID=59779 RepID=UPI002ED23455|nr:hypothetical protein FLP41_16025 [Paracoccus marcusii]
MEALTLDVPVMMLLPEGMPAAEVLGAADVPLWPFRGMDREIAAELLALHWPGSDPAALQERLPSSDELAATPMLPLMLSLRSDSVDEALRVLCDTTTTSNPGPSKTRFKRSRPTRRRRRRRRRRGRRVAFASPISRGWAQRATRLLASSRTCGPGKRASSLGTQSIAAC